MDGRANPDGAQERGLDYSAQFAVLATLPGVDVDFTGLDDVSAVRAAAAVPRQDHCLPTDTENVLTDDVSQWSSHRYTSAWLGEPGWDWSVKTPPVLPMHLSPAAHRSHTASPNNCVRLRGTPWNVG